jgi:hypothetical protein
MLVAALLVLARMLGTPMRARTLAPSNASCNGVRVAVCMCGHPRTFVRPHVYESIARELVGGLQGHVSWDASSNWPTSGQSVDVFAVMGYGDAEPKRIRGWNFAGVNSSEDDVARALAALQPRVVERLSKPLLPTNPRCRAHRDFGGAERVIAQPAAWARCLEHIVAAEEADGVQCVTRSSLGSPVPPHCCIKQSCCAVSHLRIVAGCRYRYDWVVRTRPDAFWHGRHPPLCRMPEYGGPMVLMHSQYYKVSRYAGVGGIA